MFWDVFYSVLMLLTGIGVFLIGVSKFSALLQSNSSRQVNELFKRMGDNKVVGFGLGVGVTTVIQSSTATTVIVVGLVNAGIMTFAQSTAVIFGANVGSALANVMLALSTFRVRYFFMVLAFFGAFTKIVTKNQRANKISDAMIAFSVIFIGLYIMSSAFSGNEYLTRGFTNLFEGASFPLLLILLGFAITAILNSSTGAAALFITMAANDVLTFTSIMYLVLGTFLGTTLTTLLASITASRCAKRAAVMHLMFNLAAIIIFLPIIWSLQGIIAPFIERVISEAVWQIVLFSLVVKLGTAIILLTFFVGPLNKLAYKIVPERPEQITMIPKEEEAETGFSGTF